MTSPRSYDGVGYPSPSFGSGTPIYDSLVAERGVPQIAPINVPAALPPATGGYGSSYQSSYLPSFDSPGSNLPALPPARLALGPGPSSAPMATHIPAQTGPAMYPAPQPPMPGYASAPSFQQAPPSYQSQAGQGFNGQSFGGQNTFAQAPQGFGGQGFNGQSFGGQNTFAQAPQQQSFGDQSFGGNQLRPTAPVAPMRPAPQQYGGQTQYPQYPQAG
ncbi:DUF6643 family protein [Kitasatospora sp. NPDC049258]|uniref:DUF6643 family protein n=1 Tax=Kitasatospora sp. NPDC049258 TaxID=3155394 RepID=UPI0034137F10